MSNGDSNGSSTYTSDMTSANVNPSNSLNITLTAQWSLVNYVKTFSYTGSAQTWTVPYAGNYKVELWGASGGDSYYGENGTEKNILGGRGGYVCGDININKNTNLFFYIGQKGPDTDDTNKYNGAYNGGGHASLATTRMKARGGAGGGATDIRTASGTWNNASSLRSRIMVAGGGGGSNGYHSVASLPVPVGGDAGGLTGYNGLVGSITADTSTYTAPTQSTGGTQISGGLAGRNYQYGTPYDGGFGYGGYIEGTGDVWGGGGGAGWYGGGAGGTRTHRVGSGAGGSSYISGHTGSVGVTSTSSSSPKSGCTTGTTNNSCSISPYGYTFTNTNMVDGQGYKWTNTKGSKTGMPKTSGSGTENGHSGNGYAKITWLGN